MNESHLLDTIETCVLCETRLINDCVICDTCFIGVCDDCIVKVKGEHLELSKSLSCSACEQEFQSRGAYYLCTCKANALIQIKAKYNQSQLTFCEYGENLVACNKCVVNIPQGSLVTKTTNIVGYPQLIFSIFAQKQQKKTEPQTNVQPKRLEPTAQAFEDALRAISPYP